MHRINQIVPPPEVFKEIWSVAGQHLSAQGQGALMWLKSDFQMPMPEHLAFRIGNQLFFVWIEVEDHTPLDDNRRALISRKARVAQGHGCLLPLRRRGSELVPSGAGWSLFDIDTGLPVDPVALVSDEDIVMTDWEIHDFAVFIVRNRLAKDGFKIESWQSEPDIEPAIWFHGKNGLEWIVVRGVRYPVLEASMPSDIAAIRQSCRPLSSRGNFASVSLASPDDPFNPDGSDAVPLLRGYQVIVRFDGLKAL
jgi:hypothetical protein